MKIIIAPDKYKGISTSREIAEIIGNQIQKKFPDAQLLIFPIADGGEGTLSSVIYLLGGQTLTATVNDPLMRPTQAQYGIAQLPQKGTGIVEMAQASGLYHLSVAERNPMETSSYGTGELLLECVRKHGARHLYVSLGGSATNDGGLGMLQALGAVVQGKNPFPPKGLAGKHLSSITSIDLKPALKNLKNAKITGLVDVTVPLLGDHGAARLFGPQKGATPAMVEELERGLSHLENVLSEASGLPLKNQSGAGAAGGMGLGLLALGGNLESGFDFVARTIGLEDQMRGCDMVITAEGFLDKSSREGKAPVSVARLAKKIGVPCVAVVGAMAPGLDWLQEAGLTQVLTLFDGPISKEDKRRLEVPQRLAEAANKIF
jgi:glycerate kinase